MSKNNSTNPPYNIFALAQNRNKTPSSIPYSPIFKYTRLLTRNEKIGISVLSLIIILGIVFFLHWKDIINLPFLPPSTKQHPEK